MKMKRIASIIIVIIIQVTIVIGAFLLSKPIFKQYKNTDTLSEIEEIK